MNQRDDTPHACRIAEYLRLRPYFEEGDHDLLAELLSLHRIPRQRPTPDDPDDRVSGAVEPLREAGSPLPKRSGKPLAVPHDYPARIPALGFARHLGSRPKKNPVQAQPVKPVTRIEPGSWRREYRQPALLQTWEALWPFLSRELARDNPHNRIDIDRLIRDLCAVRPLRTLPRTANRAWPHELVVLVDGSDHLQPVFPDFERIVARLKQWFPQRITLWLLEDAERPEVIELRPDASHRHRDLPPLPLHAALLVLSDLGLAHPSPWSRLAWCQRGRRLQRSGLRPLALLPAHPADWDDDTTSAFRCAFLDRGRPLQCQPSPNVGRDASWEMEQLLTLLAPMARITPALLRDARLSHPVGLSISVELAFWSRPDFGISPAWREWRDGDLQRRYLARLARAPELQTVAEGLMARHEQSLPMRLQILQKQDYAPIRSLPLTEPQETYLAHQQALMDGLQGVERRFLDNWLSRLETGKGEAHWLPGIEPLYRKYYARLAPEARAGKTPPDLGEGERWWLQIRGVGSKVAIGPIREQEVLVPVDREPAGPDRLAVVPARGPVVVRGYDGDLRMVQQTLQPGESFAFSGALSRLTLDTGSHVETIDWPTCPPWATGIGRDRYGLFVEVEVEGVAFTLRWIPPGEFLMGSPPDEPERFPEEGPQHLVRFAQGFWLAETACTQALWRAVTGENPSRFKGEERPVEWVFWDDLQRFIEQLNRRKPGLALRLPSEAEWEYACRAGTETPFWFGSELTTEKANYDGNHPYADGPKGEYREETVPVKTFRRNPWGLYQMHGNVYEWCEDRWHGNYEGAPEDGTAWIGGEEKWAVLRGGSWISHGGRLRSAYRYIVSRAPADVDFGFRLARGPELQPDPDEL